MSAEAGFIFDWDGVVVDSSRQHEGSWERLARHEGRPLPEGHFKRGFGKKNHFIIPNLLGWTRNPGEIERLSQEKERLYREIVAETGLEPLPGVAAFVAELRERGCPCSVGSSTLRLNIETALETIGLAGAFDAVVTAEDVDRGKPDPEVFLKAAAKMGCPPERCLVFEDSFSGIEAGLAGGMTVAALATTHSPEALEGRGASRILASFEGFDVDQALSLLGLGAGGDG